MSAHSLAILDGEFEPALTAVERALSLNPNSPNGWWVSGVIHAYLQQTATALDHLSRARRLNPFEDYAHSYWMAMALAYFFAGNYQEATEAADKSLAENAGFPPALRIKIVSCGLLGRIDEGRQYVHRLLAVLPGASVAGTREFFAPLMRRIPDALKNYLEGLRRCGLPER